MKNTALILILILFNMVAFAGSEEGDSSATSQIEFVSFKAIVSSKIVHFSWEVQSETRGDHFEIEKSVDMEQWVLLSRVESIVSHREQHTYKISEINLPEAAYEYFRIVRVDKDQVRTVLDVVNINQPVLSDMWLLAEKNKFNKQINVAFNSMICAEAEIKLLNADQELIRVKHLNVNSGHNKTPLIIKNLTEGNYTILIRDEFGNEITRPLVIRKKPSNGRTKF